jgi:dTDP-4-amino-4,6-dideoxygalactose transaminase
MKIAIYSPTIRRKEMNAVLSAMVEDKIGPGEQAKLLIQTAREKLNFDTCVALRSPAIALHLALSSLGIKPGKGVLISALSPLYYARVILDMGLLPIYCDVLPSTSHISRETVEKALSSKKDELDAACLVLHHTLGFSCDRAALSELGLPIIEDRSQSFSLQGIDSDNAVFTILGLEERDMLTSGGGALLYSTSRRVLRALDEQLLRNLESLPPEFGLPDMNAALAVIQFKEADRNLSKRREIADLYTQSVQRTRHKRFVHHDTEYNNYAFPLILETGVKDVKAYARRKEIEVENAFGATPAGTGMTTPEQCPGAYSLSLRTVLFPIYPRLSMADAGKVAKLIQTLP